MPIGPRLRRRCVALLWILAAATTTRGWGQEVPEVPDLLRQTISMRLVDASLVDFFRTVAELSDLNLVIDSDVSGSVTLRVERLALDQVVEMVLKSHSLERTVQDDLIRISRQETLRAEKEREQKLLELEHENQATATVARALNYASAEEAAKSLKNQLGEKGRLDVDARTNTVLMTDIPSRVAEMNRLLDRLDVAERQVEIEARIIEATTTFARNLGLQLDLLAGGNRPAGRRFRAGERPGGDGVGFSRHRGRAGAGHGAPGRSSHGGRIGRGGSHPFQAPGDRSEQRRGHHHPGSPDSDSGRARLHDHGPLRNRRPAVAGDTADHARKDGSVEDQGGKQRPRFQPDRSRHPHHPHQRIPDRGSDPP